MRELERNVGVFGLILLVVLSMYCCSPEGRKDITDTRKVRITSNVSISTLQNNAYNI